MILLVQSMRRLSQVGKKLIVLVVSFATLLALILTAVQVAMDYRRQTAAVEELLDGMTAMFPPIAASVWSFNDTHIRLSLESLVRLPDIERATVTAADGTATWTARSGQSQRIASRTFPLFHQVRGQDRQVATIELVVGLDRQRAELAWQAATILFGNAVRLALLGMFIYFLFRHLVTLRIEELARRVNGLMPQLSTDNMTLIGDPIAGAGRGDEIDAVRWAFDSMAERLKLLVADLSARNLQLAAENKERRQVQNELAAAVDQLSKALAEVERFAYVAAHDLKEPIRSIVSFSQLLERRCGGQLCADGHEYLKFIISEALRLSSLISDLLDYSRCERQTVSDDIVDCNLLVAEVLRSLAATIALTRADIQTGPLPVVRGDTGQIRQVFQNLLANALKFHRPDTPPHIRIDAEPTGDGSWLIRVTDSGIGIEPQYLDYIFEAFRRLHPRDSYPGTGIGLAICKRVVESHGGRIWVTSSPGEQTSFCFTLPDGGTP